MIVTEEMTQVAPYPWELAILVRQLKYKPNWTFNLQNPTVGFDVGFDRGQGSRGLTLVIRIITPDAYHPEEPRGVLHYFPVPPAAYDTRSWQHWLLDQILLVERHEACEFLQIGDTRPYAPSHGPGNDPYLIREVGTVEDVRTSYQGDVHDH